MSPLTWRARRGSECALPSSGLGAAGGGLLRHLSAPAGSGGSKKTLDNFSGSVYGSTGWGDGFRACQSALRAKETIMKKIKTQNTHTKSYHPVAASKTLTTFVNPSAQPVVASKGRARGGFRNCPEPHGGVSLRGYRMCSPGTPGGGRAEPPSEGFWRVKMTQLVWGVSLKVCSPDGRFKIHSA